MSGIVRLPLGSPFSSRNLACLASNPALGRQGASEAVRDIFMSPSVSENVESNETIEAVLDRAGDVKSPLSLQETTQWAIKRKILYLMPTPYNIMVT